MYIGLAETNITSPAFRAITYSNQWIHSYMLSLHRWLRPRWYEYVQWNKMHRQKVIIGKITLQLAGNYHTEKLHKGFHAWFGVGYGYGVGYGRSPTPYPTPYPTETLQRNSPWTFSLWMNPQRLYEKNPSSSYKRFGTTDSWWTGYDKVYSLLKNKGQYCTIFP